MNDIDTVSVSNALQLTGRQWLIVLAINLVLVVAAPLVWPLLERFEPDADYRVPYAQGNDYWIFNRWSQVAAEQCDTLLVGDSVVWGHFVKREQTLSHHLNALAGKQRFGNLGLDGSHPAALAGLVEHYAEGLRGKSVVLQCNPTWVSSPEPDLRDPGLQKDKTFPFNHEVLIPQFRPSIPCYRADTSTRIARVVERNVPFGGWTRHLQVAYFENKSIPDWTLDHPYENPLSAITLRSGPHDELLEEQLSWTKRGVRRMDLPWVELATSLQWGSFRRAVEILRQREVRLLVVVGPYNEHALTESSLAKYRVVKQGIEEWLRANNVPHITPAPLPSGHYADLSHPLDAGYALLAQRLFEHEFFGKVAR
jgi:hypothetical protein